MQIEAYGKLLQEQKAIKILVLLFGAKQNVLLINIISWQDEKLFKKKDTENMNKQDLIFSLLNEINSASISAENHTSDNGFCEDTLEEMTEKMRNRKYEPVGICLNPPTPCMSSDYTIAFVIKINEEIYWVHLPETYWLHLVSDYYGRKDALAIIDKLLDKKYQ